jgi:hypothetical protein
VFQQSVSEPPCRLLLRGFWKATLLEMRVIGGLGAQGYASPYHPEPPSFGAEGREEKLKIHVACKNSIGKGSVDAIQVSVA